MKKPGRIDMGLRWQVAVLYELGKVGPELRQALEQLLRGEEPNKVFGWHRKSGKEPTPDYMTDLHIGARVIYVNRELGKPIDPTRDGRETAVSHVASETGQTETRVRKCYGLVRSEWMNPDPELAYHDIIKPLVESESADSD